MATTAFDTVTQEAYKAGVIVVLSKELLPAGDPDAERTIRETVVSGLAAFIDQQFLLPTVTFAARSAPAAITNGATEVPHRYQRGPDQCGPGAPARRGHDAWPADWIMRPGTAARIAATIGGTAAVNVPRTLFGIPLILSANSPAQITLLDPSQILYSDDGGSSSRAQQARSRWTVPRRIRPSRRQP